MATAHFAPHSLRDAPTRRLPRFCALSINTGKTLFAQLLDFLPWTTFARCVARYGGDKNVRTLSRAEQFRVMTFAQLTYRESLPDIEVCLSAQDAKLYHMGFREPIRRSTLADANESRDWRIHADFAQRLIGQARALYVSQELGLDLSNTVYALDSTTIDLCLSVFPWAHFRTTTAAVKMHTLLDLRGNIPSFIHVSEGKLHDVHALDLLVPEPGAIYVMDRGYVDFGRLHTLHLASPFFVTRTKSNVDSHTFAIPPATVGYAAGFAPVPRSLACNLPQFRSPLDCIQAKHYQTTANSRTAALTGHIAERHPAPQFYSACCPIARFAMRRACPAFAGHACAPQLCDLHCLRLDASLIRCA